MQTVTQYRPDQCTCTPHHECSACTTWTKGAKNRAAVKRSTLSLVLKITQLTAQLNDTTLTSLQRKNKRYYIKQLHDRLTTLAEPT